MSVALTPFEVFRTPIQIRRFNAGFYQNGLWIEGAVAFFNGTLIAGNTVQIIGNINGNGFTFSVLYGTSQIATMQRLADAIAALQNVSQVILANAGQIMEIIPTLPAIATISSYTITGGASQPTTGFTNQPEIINATASVQPLGKDIALVPEGRRNKDAFKLYTSTYIYAMHTQNPDQITVLKDPFIGQVFETIQINEWQNNANFNVINHYKFVAMKLHPLPGVT